MFSNELPCVMWKSSRIEGTFDIGWLITSVSPFIMICGNTKNRTTAEEYASELFRKGARSIVIYDNELESADPAWLKGLITLTPEKLRDIVGGEKSTILYDCGISKRYEQNCADQS